MACGRHVCARLLLLLLVLVVVFVLEDNEVDVELMGRPRSFLFLRRVG